MPNLAWELLLDISGLVAVFIAYARPSTANKRDLDQRKRLMRAARNADRQYAIDHPWSKPLFAGIVIAFAVGGFFVAILPGSSAAGFQDAWYVRIGFVIQIICVVAMAVSQGIRGVTLRSAMREVL